jgi:signal recognition particle subunit SRP54
MVLADLGRKLNNALSALNKAPVVDEKVFSGHVRPHQIAPLIDTK